MRNRLSEHAFADALDIGSFVTESGRTVEVLRRWGETRRDVIAKAEAAAKGKAEAEKAAALALFYPEITPFAVLSVGLFFLVEWWSSKRFPGARIVLLEYTLI